MFASLLRKELLDIWKAPASVWVAMLPSKVAVPCISICASSTCRAPVIGAVFSMKVTFPWKDREPVTDIAPPTS